MNFRVENSRRKGDPLPTAKYGRPMRLEFG